MSHQVSNQDEPEEELGASSAPLEIPSLFKWATSLTLLAITILFLCYFNNYLKEPAIYAAPSDLGLVTIILFCISGIIILWTPWNKLGIRITKIGGIEFEKIVATQASEHAEEISYLQDRIETLEVNIGKSNELIGFTSELQEPALRALLLNFLTTHSKWSFSPSRIKAWGSKQEGFSELADYDLPFIRTTLKKMVSEDILDTRISKKGNTLYRTPLGS